MDKVRIITNVVNKVRTSNEITVKTEKGNDRNMYYFYDKDGKVVPERVKHPDFGDVHNSACTKSKVYTKGVWVTLQSNWFDFEKVGKGKKVCNAPESLTSAQLQASSDSLDDNQCKISPDTKYVLSDSKFAERLIECDEDNMFQVRKLYFPIRAQSAIEV